MRGTAPPRYVAIRASGCRLTLGPGFNPAEPSADLKHARRCSSAWPSHASPVHQDIYLASTVFQTFKQAILQLEPFPSRLSRFRFAPSKHVSLTPSNKPSSRTSDLLATSAATLRGNCARNTLFSRCTSSYVHNSSLQCTERGQGPYRCKARPTWLLVAPKGEVARFGLTVKQKQRACAEMNPSVIIQNYVFGYLAGCT